ncbi:MAG: GGDEF domain-containing protein [Baekduia sp.]
MRIAVPMLMCAAFVAGPLAAGWVLCSSLLALSCSLMLVRARIAELDADMWESQARRDPLTGIGNYRALHERLQQTVAADPARFALLTMDVDSFKQINDVHGHLEGDRLLQEIGRVLADSVRGDDVIARQGGDEFAVLANDADEQGADLLAERIEAALARIKDVEDRPVRASIGVAVYPRDGMTADDLLEQADAALRRIKDERYAADPRMPHRRRTDQVARVA